MSEPGVPPFAQFLLCSPSAPPSPSPYRPKKERAEAGRRGTSADRRARNGRKKERRQERRRSWWSEAGAGGGRGLGGGHQGVQADIPGITHSLSSRKRGQGTSLRTRATWGWAEGGGTGRETETRSPSTPHHAQSRSLTDLSPSALPCHRLDLRPACEPSLRMCRRRNSEVLSSPRRGALATVPLTPSRTGSIICVK